MAHILHQTKDGERWDLLAYQFYKDVTKQSVLIAANRQLFAALSVPARLPAGLLLKVPLIEASTVNNDRRLPPWKRG